MRNRIIYNLSCIIGGGLLFILPIIEMFTGIKINVGNISLASIGSLTLGSALFIDYKNYQGDAEQYKNWWKEIGGYFFILLFVMELLPLPNKISAVVNILLYSGFLLVLYIRYNQLKT